MNTKKSPTGQGGALSEIDNSTVTKTGYNGKIDIKDFQALEKALFGIQHGSASLTIFVRDGKFQYSKISKESTRNGCRDE